MKKTLIIISAVITAFLITEVFTKVFFDFPEYGITEHVIGITTLKKRGEIYKPFSKYMNNENGYNVFRRNNAGLPGGDIIITDTSKYVLVLGNSFVEGYQVEPDSISTSVFQLRLNNTEPQYQVVNLGASGHDIYDLWLRTNYFERVYSPAAVILIITENSLFNRSADLNFALPPQFGIVNNSFKTGTLTFLRNSSSFINLISTALKYSFTKKDETDNELVLKIPDNQQTDISFDTSGIGRCLIEFKSKYGEKFTAVSIIGDSSINNSFSDFCRLHQIQFNSYPLLTPEYEINQGGHLSIIGNKKLGELLYENFNRYNKK
jgi:hypothetical protein